MGKLCLCTYRMHLHGCVGMEMLFTAWPRVCQCSAPAQISDARKLVGKSSKMYNRQTLLVHIPHASAWLRRHGNVVHCMAVSLPVRGRRPLSDTAQSEGAQTRYAAGHCRCM